METLWRTGLLCTVIAIVFATEVEGGCRDEFVQSQGECVCLSVCVCDVCVCVCWGGGGDPELDRPCQPVLRSF